MAYSTFSNFDQLNSLCEKVTLVETADIPEVADNKSIALNTKKHQYKDKEKDPMAYCKFSKFDQLNSLCEKVTLVEIADIPEVPATKLF
jgi:hypothetical protein